MRNLSKILCAVLVLAVLCSSLVLLVSAEEFAPTATIENITGNPAVVNSSIMTNGMTPSWAQFEGEYNIYKVSTDDNAYVQLEALKDGKLSQNFQFQLFESSGLKYEYDANTYHYSRFEFDIATENEMADIFIRSNVRRIYDKANADGTIEADKNTWTDGATVNKLRDLGLEAGKFYHISVVQDFTANKFYIFVNGEQKACTVLFDATQHAGWVAGDASVAKSLVSGIKVESDSTNISSIKGSTLCIDNLNCTTTSVSETLEIAAFANERYTDTYVLPVVPAIASVDGVAYSSVAEINALLSKGAAKNVELLRDSVAKVTVNCSATVKANGYSFGTGANIINTVDNGDGTVTLKAASGSYEAIPAVSSANYDSSVSSVVKYNANDNIFSGIFGLNYGAAGQRANYIYTNAVTGEKFIYETVYGGVTPTANSYFEWAMSGSYADKMLKTGVNQYLMLELDIAMADYNKPADISFNTRIASDATGNTNTYLANPGADYAANSTVKGNTAVSLANVLKAAGIPEGQFAHITIAAESDTGKAYIFVNGTLETVANNAVYSGTLGTSYVFPQNLRIGQGTGKGNDFYYDNLYIKFVEDAAVAEAIADGSIALPAGHVLPTLPTLAVVDGVAYTTPEAASVALTGNGNKNAEIMYAHNYPITVNSDAVINTNGIENAIVLADGCTSVQEGAIITVDAPYIQSAYYTDASFSENAYKSAEAGNEIITNTIYNASATEWKAEYIHNAYNGDSFYKISSIVDGLPANHIQWNFFVNPQDGVKFDTENPTYVTYEFDIATESEAVALDITPNVRTGQSGGGSDRSQNTTYLDNTAFMLADAEAFKFHHVAIVMDYNSNVMYVYFDNGLVWSGAFIASSHYDNWVAGAELLYSGIKLQASGAYTINGEYVTPLKVGQNLFIANAYAKTHRDDAAADLAAALTAGDITAWSGNRFNASYNLPKLPVLATVDGIECTTVAEIEALCHGTEAKTVEFMRDFDAEVNLGCTAHTVITNGVNVNVTASHIGYAVDFVAATCTTNGNWEYYHCDICGQNAETSATDAYIFGENEYVLGATGHARATKIDAVAATHTANGNIEYWHCNVCGLNTTGKAPEAEIIPEGEEVVLAMGHMMATKVDAVPATHTTNGNIEYWYCAICNANFTDRLATGELIPAGQEVILATGHIRAEKHEAVLPTCTETGIMEYYYCAECDANFTDRSPEADLIPAGEEIIPATGHIRATKVDAVAATHTAHGNIEYWHCDVCGLNTTGRAPEAEIIPEGEEVVLSMGHLRAEKHDAIPATHTQTGTVEYYYCSVCDACFAGTDYNSDKLITPADFTLLPIGHIRAELVEAIPATHTENGVAAYYYCADCDAKFESRNSVTSLTSADLVILAMGHIRAELVAAVPATHTAHGVAEYYYCADCDLKLESRAPDAAVLTDEDLVVLSLGHERAEKHEAIPFTHTETGVREYYYCAVCDQNYDGTAYNAVALTDEELVLLPLGHVKAELIPGTPATHTTAGTIDSYYCEVCQASFTGRAPEAKILTSVTEYVIPALGHINGSWIDSIPATHTENGVAPYYYCAECDLKLDGEDFEAAVLTDAELVLLATGHVRAEKVDAAPATCTESGNIAYWYCADCGANYTGRAPEAKLLADSEIKILPAHKWGSEHVEVEDGHCRKCTVCDATLSVEEHTMNEDYVCTACGHTEVPTSFFDMLAYYFKQFLEMIANLFSGSKA